MKITQQELRQIIKEETEKELAQEDLGAALAIVMQMLNSRAGRSIFAKGLRLLAKMLSAPMVMSGKISDPLMDKIRQGSPQLGEAYDAIQELGRLFSGSTALEILADSIENIDDKEADVIRQITTGEERPQIAADDSDEPQLRDIYTGPADDDMVIDV